MIYAIVGVRDDIFFVLEIIMAMGLEGEDTTWSSWFIMLC